MATCRYDISLLVFHSRSHSPHVFWSVPRRGALEKSISRVHDFSCSGFTARAALVYMASRNKVDLDAFHNGIQYALEKLGKSKFGVERTAVSKFKNKRHVGSGNEIVDYSRAPCLGADQKTRGLWEQDCLCSA